MILTLGPSTETLGLRLGETVFRLTRPPTKVRGFLGDASRKTLETYTFDSGSRTDDSLSPVDVCRTYTHGNFMSIGPLGVFATSYLQSSPTVVNLQRKSGPPTYGMGPRSP